MADVNALEEAVRALAPSDLAESRCWFSEFDSTAWDREIEADVAAGRLNSLIAEAVEDYSHRPRRSL